MQYFGALSLLPSLSYDDGGGGVRRSHDVVVVVVVVVIVVVVLGVPSRRPARPSSSEPAPGTGAGATTGADRGGRRDGAGADGGGAGSTTGADSTTGAGWTTAVSSAMAAGASATAPIAVMPDSAIATVRRRNEARLLLMSSSLLDLPGPGGSR